MPNRQRTVAIRKHDLDALELRALRLVDREREGGLADRHSHRRDRADLALAAAEMHDQAAAAVRQRDPDVAVEQGWTKEETIESLMRKAGWDGGVGSVARRLLRTNDGGPGTSKPWEQVSDFRTVKYQGLKASASYADWQEWREWVVSLDDGREVLGLT